MGVTAPEASLFHVLHFGLTLEPAALADRASWRDYTLAGPSSEEDCRAALAACLEKGWLQVIDESVLAAISDELRQEQILGPIYGLPCPREVDFTVAGADLWLKIQNRPDQLPRVPFAYSDAVGERTEQFFLTESAALAEVESLQEEEDVVSVQGPFPTGPWRAQWWRRFPTGYRIQIDQRRQWEGRAISGRESCYVNHLGHDVDLDRLRHVLDRRHVTLEEWVMMESMEYEWSQESPEALCGHVARYRHRWSKITISREQCRTGLEACLQKGWLRVEDRAAIEEIETLLRDDPVVLAVPKIAKRLRFATVYYPDPLQPGKFVPRSENRRPGAVDFTPSGAALYQDIAADWLGADWENRLHVSAGLHWEEHRYCETDGGLVDLLDQYTGNGNVIRASRLVPIGPWCVYWWNRFPAGYRLEVEISPA